MAHLLLYGGTFDPVHHGHLIACRAAREYLGADQVLLIPAWVSPHKTCQGSRPDGASAAQRLEMLRLAIAGEPAFAVDDRELVRGAAGEKASYTLDTVESLARERPADRFTLLIGADQLPKLHTWHGAAQLFTIVDIGVLGRPSDRSLQAALVTVRQHMGATLANRLTLLPTPLIEISATQIRQRVRSAQSIAYLVPEKVAQYIQNDGLYLPIQP
jgi:nicotinate-nucleotide adenylyltransferase